jgi:hypothetical protein
MTATATRSANGTAPVADEPSAGIRLEPIAVATYDIPIEGLSPLIIHAFSEKAKQMMRDKQSGARSRKKLEPKVPEQEAEAAMYRLPDGRTGLPAVAFKAAIVGAARLYDGLTLVETKQLIFVEGEGPDQLVPIEGDWYVREDTPRIGQGTTDLRYRPCFPEWSATLRVTFVPMKIDLESVVNLTNAGGLGGVGEWRPSAPKSLTGTFGRFGVIPDASIEQIR